MGGGREVEKKGGDRQSGQNCAIAPPSSDESFFLLLFFLPPPHPPAAGSSPRWLQFSSLAECGRRSDPIFPPRKADAPWARGSCSLPLFTQGWQAGTVRLRREREKCGLREGFSCVEMGGGEVEKRLAKFPATSPPTPAVCASPLALPPPTQSNSINPSSFFIF